MSIDVSKISLNKLNSLFVDKYVDYLYLMSNFMTQETMDERKNIVLNNFRKLSTDFYYQKKEYDIYASLRNKFEKDVRFLEVFTQIENEYNKSKISLEKIFDSEISFLNYITTDFELNNGETHGLIHKSSDGTIHHEGINQAITYSVINTLAFSKRRNGEPFDYPMEMETGGETSLYQVRDVLAMDVMEVFGEGIIADFFLGNGDKFNKDFRHAFMAYTTTEDGLFTDEDIAKRTIQNMKNFEEGVAKSFKKNDESYFSNYIGIMKKLKDIVKTTDFTYADDVYNRVKRGLK